MFGHAYFGGAYFGAAYWAPASARARALPHDDYDAQWRPWYQFPDVSEARKQALDELRREVGLLPKREQRQIEARTTQAVRRSVARLLHRPEPTRRAAFDAVKTHEDEYAKALRQLLARPREADLRRAFEIEVELALAQAWEDEIEDDDTEVMELLARLL